MIVARWWLSNSITPSTLVSGVPTVGKNLTFSFIQLRMQPISVDLWNLILLNGLQSFTIVIYFVIYCYLLLLLFILSFKLSKIWPVDSCVLSALPVTPSLFFGGVVLSLYCSTRASLVAVHRLSCPAACPILVPRPGIEPASPALEGGFFTTAPPGKSLPVTLLSTF